MMNISEKYYNENSLDDNYNEEEMSDPEAHVLANRNEKMRMRRKYNSELVSHIGALGRYIFDKNVKWYKKSLVIAALAYFVKPKNVLPNWNEFFAFLDDVGAIEWTVRFLGKELNKYY